MNEFEQKQKHHLVYHCIYLEESCKVPYRNTQLLKRKKKLIGSQGRQCSDLSTSGDGGGEEEERVGGAAVGVGNANHSHNTTLVRIHTIH